MHGEAMTALWYFPFDTNEFQRVTASMNAEERGCYISLMTHYWQHGSLPDELKKLKIICATSNKKSIFSALELFEKNDKNFSHSSLDSAKKNAEKKGQKNRDNINARWAKNKVNTDTSVENELLGDIYERIYDSNTNVLPNDIRTYYHINKKEKEKINKKEKPSYLHYSEVEVTPLLKEWCNAGGLPPHRDKFILDLDVELAKFKTYWDEGDRWNKMKRTDGVGSFKKWLVRAVEHKLGKG